MKHPNALAGVAGTGIGGEIVLEFSSWFGWSISSGLAIWIAALVTGVVLFVGRNGADGLWNLIKHGTGGARPEAGFGEVSLIVLGVCLGVIVVLLLKAY